MLGAFLYGPKDLRLREVEIPTISDNEILVKTKSVAICGTDIRMYNNGHKDIDENNPKILGHEISGTIEKVGENVKHYKKGMRVAIAPNMGCGVCDMCVSGNTHLCKEYRAFGININGGFAEYIKIPENAVRQGNIIEISDNISFDEASLIEPLSCVYNGQSQVNIKSGETVLVIGAGPIGIMHALLAKMQGASKVIVNDLSEERLRMCKDIDESILTISSEGLQQKVFDATKGLGVDVCIIAAPAPTAQTFSVNLMNTNGRILFFGGLPADKENILINSNIIHYKQLSIHGSTRASLIQYRNVLRIVTSGKLNLKPLISRKFSLKEINKAFELAGNAKGLKNIINFE